MAGLKSLLKDTAIYGISSIVGRFLNYLLVPIYAASMSAASGGYGVVTEVYAWTAHNATDAINGRVFQE